MKVTPLDLRQQRFNTVMRGYDRGEVTAFLNEVADDYENALREADRLRQEVVKLEAVLAEHRGQERNLRNTLLTAQKMADEVKDRCAVALGTRVTGAGISADLDEALQLVVMIFGRKVARRVQVDIQYFPDPPVKAKLKPAKSCPLPAP